MDITTIIIGSLLVLSGFVLVNIFRKGLGNINDTRKNINDKIKKTETNLHKQIMAIGREEQLHIMSAAVKEIISTKKYERHAEIIEENSNFLRLNSENGEIKIAFTPKTAKLASQKGRVVHGQGKWHILHNHNEEIIFTDLDLAVKHIISLLIIEEN